MREKNTFVNNNNDINVISLPDTQMGTSREASLHTYLRRPSTDVVSRATG